ncbi:MAG: U32 family peptidase [Wujia sp.]
MINNIKKPEILAPCGSYDILVAAVKAGADACYIGGSRFGARAYAENLSDDSILSAIDYAHIHGVKLYLTVNTLFKNNEINELYDYLNPYYEAGLDAVIVQDLGVFKRIRDIFPDLHVHCSTQMNITSVYGAQMMKALGATRVVTAREMAMDEIRTIKDSVDIEVETFVHGAMCYAYSGQCLLSSMAGGRSGNRGRCAQPCRKCYNGEYILSMKDMCSLELLPALIDAGIDSLKIEGRMKNAYYVASAVDAYRKVRDACMNGTFSESMCREYKRDLAGIYNRGGFCNGYFLMEKPLHDMISRERPNHQGLPVGIVCGINDGKIRVRLSDDLYRGDVIEIAYQDGSKAELTTGVSGLKNSVVELKAPGTRHVLTKQTVFRTKCSRLMENIEKNILSAGNDEYKIGLTGVFYAHVGEKMQLSVTRELNGQIWNTTISDDVVDISRNRPADPDQIREKLSQLGDTEYYWDSLEIDISDNVFVPMGKIKQLRRNAIMQLEALIVQDKRRHTGDNIYESRGKLSDHSVSHPSGDNNRFIKVGVSTEEQLMEVLKHPYVYGIYMSRHLYDKAAADGILQGLREKDIKIYITLPYIIHSSFSLEEYLPNDKIHGIYIRNIDGFACAMQDKNIGELEIVCGFSLYAYNEQAREFILDICPDAIFENPHELVQKEYQVLGIGTNELNLYGYQQVMLSAQCVVCNRSGCRKRNEYTQIRDDKGNTFFARCICDECCNVIYNGTAYNILGAQQSIIQNMHVPYLNLMFSVEDAAETDAVMRMAYRSIIEEQDTFWKQNRDKIYTSGHWYRGVE